MDREIASRCSRLFVDAAGFIEMSTPEGTYWVPKDTEQILAVLIGQEETVIYCGACYVGNGQVRPEVLHFY
jgi:hypothetical protein